MLGASLAVLGGAGVRSQEQAALPAAPSIGGYWVDPISGNDSRSASQARSSSSSPSSTPWKTLSKAISEWNAGNLSASASGHVEIILRGGLSYERGNDLDITRTASSGSHLVIKGYRDDIEAGTRGGTGKYTGAEGRFVLRGNIAALETGSWEDAGLGHNIYRSTSTYSISGNARGYWLGDTTYNLQLVPARNINDLDTNTVTGSTDVYSAPGVVNHNSRFHVRLDTNVWTDYFGEDFFDVAPTWGTNPNSESLAVFDDTNGIRFTDNVSYVDFQFWNIEYWQIGIKGTSGITITHFNMDYITIKASFSSLDLSAPVSELGNCDWTHCDFIANVPPWGERNWIHGSGGQPQSEWDGLCLNVHAVDLHDILVEHCRFVRPVDGFTLANGTPPAPLNITLRHNHFYNCRDDSCAFASGSTNVEITFNYYQWCFLGVGQYEHNIDQSIHGSFYVGFNIFDLSKYTFVNGHNDLGTAFDKGTSSTPGGRRCGRVDPNHGSGVSYQERMYYHNTIICGKDANSNGGSTDVLAFNSDELDANNPSEHYNNIFVQVEDASFLGKYRSNSAERDYNCLWYNPSGDTFGGTSTRLRPGNAAGSDVGYSSWAAFVASGSHYNETKHANGDGPGSPQGWDNHGKFANPEFVGGDFTTIVGGSLETYFPEVDGNLKFAASLTGTGWPQTDAALEYVGAYQPGDQITKLGPEQGLWVD